MGWLGISHIAAVVVLWVASSELIQLIFDSSLSFESPLFLTFFSTSLFSVYLAGFLVCPSWRHAGDARTPDAASPRNEEATRSLLDQEEGQAAGVRQCAPAAEAAWLAAQFAPLWFISNWTFNASLCQSCGTGTSVSTSTLLSSSNSVFTFVLSVIFLREPFSLLKLACTALNLGGVALLVLYDPASSERPRIHTTAGSASATGTGDPGTDSFAGNCMAVVSAACSAAYAVQLKRMLPADSDAAARVSMPMLFGFLGITVALMCMPIFLVFIALRAQGWANLELMHTLAANPRILAALTVNGFLGTVLSDLLWARAVVLTSPLITNLGIGFTIPLAFFVDHGMVLVSFVVVTLLDHRATPNDAVPAMYATSPPASYAPPPPPPPSLQSLSPPPLSSRTQPVLPRSATCSLASASPSEGRETLDTKGRDGERGREEREREAALAPGFSSTELLRRYADVDEEGLRRREEEA